MKKIIIALIVLAIVGAGTYYFVFNKAPGKTPAKSPETYTVPSPSGLQITASAPTTFSTAVNIKDFAFDPPSLTIQKGTKITWTNNDDASHKIVSDESKTLNSPILSAGQSYSFTFTDTGSINYYCGLHPTMKGKIIVID